MIDLAGKIVLAHKGFFNRESEQFYQENSKKVCEISAKKDYIQIIEVDVRKSKDGILYCYHGKPLQYYFSLRFPRMFSEIKQKYRVDTLKEILSVIPEDKIVLLDIKSKSITREDILSVLRDRKFKEVILGHTAATISFLERFSDMPANFSKALNGHIFCKFYNLKKLREKNYKYFEVVFPFQVNKAIMRKVEASGMKFHVAGLFFRNPQNYWEAINKYGIQQVSSDFI